MPTAAEMADFETAVVAAGTSQETLMERAGAAVASASAALAGGWYGRRAVVVCGSGNNGGDGAVAARLLRDAGMTVELLWVGAEPTGLAADVRARAARADVVVDAMLGIGARGAPRGATAEAVAAFAGVAAPIVSVDVPSGVGVDTGAIPGPAVAADATVTFGAHKPCLVLPPAARLAGTVEVVDVFRTPVPEVPLGMAEDADVARVVPARSVDAHKRSAGVVGVVGGSATMIGAVALAATAASRAGAGLVRVAVPSGILPAVATLVPEATFLAVDVDRREPLEGSLADVDALVVGPGLGRSPGVGPWVRELVASGPVPIVLDADGLAAFEGHLDDLAAASSSVVLTPHAGEFARLSGVDAASLAEDRLGHARGSAARVGCIVALKGPGTIVAHPDGRAVVDTVGNATLATAGTGDVLAGVIGAFVARGASPFDAAWAAVRVHAVAGRLAGGAGVVAGDVVERLPAALGWSA